MSPLPETSIQRLAEAALTNLEIEHNQCLQKCKKLSLELDEARSALHFWLKRVHVSSLRKDEQAQFSEDYKMSRGE